MVWISWCGNISGSASEAFTDGSKFSQAWRHGGGGELPSGRIRFLTIRRSAQTSAFWTKSPLCGWVQENIEVFRRRPHAGASVRVLRRGGRYSRNTAITLGQGLFSRCVIQSAGGEDPAAAEISNSPRSRAATQALFQSLGTNDIDALRAIPAERVAAAARPLSGVVVAVHAHHMTSRGRPSLMVRWWRTTASCLAGRHASHLLLLPERGALLLDPAKAYTPQDVEAMARKLTGPKVAEVMAILEAEGGSPYSSWTTYSLQLFGGSQQYAACAGSPAKGRRVYYYALRAWRPGRPRASGWCSMGRTSTIVRQFDRARVRRHRPTHIERAAAGLHRFAKSGIPKGPDGVPWPTFQSSASQAVLGERCGVVWPLSWQIQLSARCIACASKPDLSQTDTGSVGK